MQSEDDQFKPVDEQRTLLEVGSESKDVKQPEAPQSATQPAAPRSTSPLPMLDIHFGNVRATQQLGAGGMGKVYKGHHEGLDIDVAIKVMSGELAKDLTARQRFMREARTAAKLDHPNVVRVLTVDEQDGTPYIVMEFVDGSDMAALVKQAGRLNPIAVLQALAQVADGLAAAHEQGIIHRDIKPHNIFVSKQGRVKLGDFGLARATEQTTELTMPGSAMGTAHYMSPEQAQGHELGTKSDVYSLGITAYHLLSGQTPYTGTTPLSIAVQHVNNDVPYDRAKFGHVPDAAVYFLIAMTQRDAARRPSAADAGRELRKILHALTGRDEVKLPGIEALSMPMGTTNFAPARTAPTMPAMQRPVPPQNPPPIQAPHRPQGALQTPPGFAPTTPQFAPPQQFATPGTPTQPLPPTQTPWQPPPEKSSNALLFVAIAVVVLVLLFFVGCGALMSMKP
ncbi:MAG: serine/threonine protein kinase [Planctomycetes bacterium]|nr:serine/threonine protein kinase [Planctomycetota bacterium]